MPPAAGRHRSLIANSLRAILTVETGLLTAGVVAKGEKIVSIVSSGVAGISESSGVNARE